MKSTALVPAALERQILSVRGQRVLLDSDLAVLYGVETKLLTRAMRRNIERFPPDFAFQLTAEEHAALRIQSGTSNDGRGGRRYAPYAFTEQGVAMLSSVLRSERAVQVNIEIMRTFVRLREMLATHADLARKLAALERKYDQQFRMVFDAIRELMAPPTPKKPRAIGFRKGVSLALCLRVDRLGGAKRESARVQEVIMPSKTKITSPATLTTVADRRQVPHFRKYGPITPMVEAVPELAAWHAEHAPEEATSSGSRGGGKGRQNEATAANSLFGRRDSNPNSRNQNPLSCH